MNRRKLLGLATVTLILAAGIGAFQTLREDRSSSVVGPFHEVRRGEFIRRIWADGTLEATQATPLGPPPDLQQPLKIAWLAPDGTLVRKGDVVIRFDPTDLEKERNDGRFDRRSADSRIRQAEALASGVERGLERDAAMAELDLTHAEKFTHRDEEIFSRTAIIESGLDAELARARRNHADTQRETRRRLGQTEAALLEIERRKADLRIRQADQGLRALEVVAPHDGILTLKSQWGRTPEIGQVVWGGATVAELPSQDQLEARVFVLEADAGGLKEGIPGELRLASYPGTTWSVTITRADKLAKRRFSRNPVQYFGVTLGLSATDPEKMKVGQRVEAVLTLDERKDALTVPRQAVFDREGQSIVWRRTDEGAVEPVTVGLGPSSAGIVVIEEGLAPGDRVALTDPNRPIEPVGSPAGAAAIGAGPGGL